MTFFFAIREREGGKWLARHDPDGTEGTFVSDQRRAKRWTLDDEREVRDIALVLPLAVDVLSISDAP